MPEDIKMDPREKTAEEIEGLMHDAARLCRTAVMSDDDTTKNTLKLAIRALADQAIKRLDESVGASEADQADEED